MEVVSASHGVLGPLLGKLTTLLANECGRLKGVRREIRSLRAELRGMHAALKKYTELEDPDVQVKAWISLVRELAYDTEDCFDKFVHHLGNGAHNGGFKEFCRKTARRLKTLGARRGIASQIDDLKLRIKEVKDLKTSYNLDDIACSTSGHASVDPRLSALFAEEAHLVGIDDPRDDLAKWVLEEKHHRRVLSIVGFGGLGKTTLANEVYRKIQGHFHCWAFVSVSQKPDTKKIIRDVIFQVISQVSCRDEFTKDIELWDERKLIEKLRELLQDKRYLVIIDDVWSIWAWNAISCAFPQNDCSSRIIATTRILEVASSCCPCTDDHIYKMTPLSNLHSERLFFRRIFGSEDRCPDMLKEISNAILKKCGGLPLAIISISSLLANRPRVKEEWEKVKRSIGSDLNKSQSLEGMKNILSLSYSDLPPNLKTCLLYLSSFPEDCVIERERLVRRWIAEGFISEERGQSYQEVAEKCFYELINKSMVQPVDIGYDGKVRACRVHDMMLELIISKSIEENFITVVNGRQTIWENSECFIRRLSIQDIDQELASELANKDLSHVRSLTVTGSGCIKYLPSLVKFETLRVLDFEGCRGLKEYDMNGMDKLFQLKYLSFKKTDIYEIPSGIVMLHDLETLDLTDRAVKELPAGIVQLTKLQYLLTHGTQIPVGIGNMTKLREISGLLITRSSVDAVEELGSLINLNVLDVSLAPLITESDKYKRHTEMLLSSLCKLGTFKLQSVRIQCANSYFLELLDSWSPPPSCLQRFWMTSSDSLPKIPMWISPTLTSLAYLDIDLSEVTEEDLRILGELPALLHLGLDAGRSQKGRLVVHAGEFRCLKEFQHYGGGANFLFEEGALPKLEKLELSFYVSIANTYEFYLGIEHLPCLNDVEVDLDNEGATYLESKAAAVAIRKEANLNPNQPRVTLRGEIWRPATGLSSPGSPSPASSLPSSPPDSPRRTSRPPSSSRSTSKERTRTSDSEDSIGEIEAFQNLTLDSDPHHDPIHNLAAAPEQHRSNKRKRQDSIGGDEAVRPVAGLLPPGVGPRLAFPRRVRCRIHRGGPQELQVRPGAQALIDPSTGRQDHLKHEIKMEIKKRGRASLVNLSDILGVDLYHVKRQALEVVMEDPALMLINGEIMSQSYWDTVTEEINENVLDNLQKQLDEAVLDMQLYEKALDVFEDDPATSVILHKHLLRTLGTPIVDKILLTLGKDNKLKNGMEVEDSEEHHVQLSIADRTSLAKDLPGSLSLKAQSLVEALEGKRFDSFMDALRDMTEESGLLFKKLDKRLERSMLHSHRKDLASQVSSENDPVSFLPKVVALLFLQAYNKVLQAPGRAVGAVITLLKDKVFTDYHSTTVKLLALQAAVTDDEEDCTSDRMLEKEEDLVERLMPELKSLVLGTTSKD